MHLLVRRILSSAWLDHSRGVALLVLLLIRHIDLEQWVLYGSTDPMVALSLLDDTKKILDEGMQCPDEDRVRIVGFLLWGTARKWWAYERTKRRQTWAQFKTAFHTEFCPPAFVETKRLEFETLTQGSMTVSEYERRFRELSDFCPNLGADEVSKKRRFLDGLSEPIALSLLGSDHPMY